jgi:cell division cycle protein 20 (cofactor of APC complex)
MLAVGTSDASTKLFDVETETVVRSLAGHTKRVCSAAFTYGLLYTGSRDSMVCAHDHRCRSSVVMKMRGHRGEVCGLKHNPCGLASGSNDNMVIVWDLTMGKPKNYLLDHKAAVKALSWCPWQRNLLSSGGGSSDKTIRLWNTETGKCVKEINAESQVCSLLWNSEER